jgi:hypothetical protein
LHICRVAVKIAASSCDLSWLYCFYLDEPDICQSITVDRQAAVGGRRLQREQVRYNSVNRLAVMLLIALAFSGLVFMLLVPGRMMIRGMQRFSVSLHSQFVADYSADLHAVPVAPVGMSLIGEALTDRENAEDLPGVFEALNTPVPVVTPLPVFLPTSALFPIFPTLPPIATPVPPTAASTATWTATPTRTPTGTLTATIPATRTATEPDSTATRTPTPPTPDTPLPPTGYPPQPTSTPRPTFTSTVPNHTPVPGVTPSEKPTATPETPTGYP